MCLRIRTGLVRILIEAQMSKSKCQRKPKFQIPDFKFERRVLTFWPLFEPCALIFGFFPSFPSVSTPLKAQCSPHMEHTLSVEGLQGGGYRGERWKKSEY